MTTVAVVYHSDSGRTKILAEAILEGVRSHEGIRGELHEIERRALQDGFFRNDELFAALDKADAIVFGCPTFMGNVSAPMKAFLEATLKQFSSGAWKNKLASGFTVSGTPSGDKSNTLNSLLVCALQLGMIWVGLDQSPANPENRNRLGFFMGAAGQADFRSSEPALHPGDRETGVAHGLRMASLARKYNPGV